MADPDHIAQLRKGVAAWNEWRLENPSARPDLIEANLSGADLSRANLRYANLSRANLSGADLRGTDLSRAVLYPANLSGADLSEADLRAATLHSADLSRANLSGADLRGTDLHYASLSGADLRGAGLGEATLICADLSGADLRGATLHGANLSEANFERANLSGANLRETSLIRTRLLATTMTGARVYGASAWDVETNDETKQTGLIITPKDQSVIIVDDLEVAQFIYLLLHNKKIRGVIDTITSKAVLILGRFTDERKAVLDALRDELRNRNLLPILFDFPPSQSLDVTETIKVLAGLARFVIADVTDATEVRVELHNIVRDFTSLPIQPILLRGREPFVSLSHVQKFPWVLPTFEYNDEEHLLASLDKSIISPAEDTAKTLRS